MMGGVFILFSLGLHLLVFGFFGFFLQMISLRGHGILHQVFLFFRFISAPSYLDKFLFLYLGINSLTLVIGGASCGKLFFIIRRTSQSERLRILKRRDRGEMGLSPTFLLYQQLLNLLSLLFMCVPRGRE